ncbi:hypothetical protein HBA54_21815 [Pelagibius litoralis]|uniref:Uncharacterized protein n=1 Tax=Pelagibius litoralis TaxID=374515 RepID=A0A967F1I7_9PROT|nr:hypothetical protein [Pelagibius litoralis]NIA71241.1 hypothetical protein [Pelagibius litoralis]
MTTLDIAVRHDRHSSRGQHVVFDISGLAHGTQFGILLGNGGRYRDYLDAGRSGEGVVEVLLQGIAESSPGCNNHKLF